MNLGLRGKVAIVCGASLGMGKAIARLLVQEGAKVAIIARHEKELKQVAAEISLGRRGSALPVVCDLSKIEKIPAVVKRIKRRFGTIHILVNNAGGPPPGGLFEVQKKDWEQAIRQNLQSAIIMTQQVVPTMKKEKFGRIINITSQLVKEPSSDMLLSTTVRSGVVAFAKTISRELAPYGITVNTLCPGPIMTERMRHLINLKARKFSKAFSFIQKEITNSIPINRIGTAEEFAAVAVFLASECASYVTGTTLAVDGGITRSLM